MKEKRKINLLDDLWVSDWQYNWRIMLVFIAGEVLMAYSPFGFIVLPNISMTTLFIGVLVAALWGGPFSGAVIGLVFGLTSMWKASVTAVNPNDLIFSPVKSGNPIGSIILALAPRILFGIIAGIIYYIIMNWCIKKVRLPIILLASVILERVHSMLIYLFMDKVFHVEGAYMAKAWTNLLSVNRLKNYVIVMSILLISYLVYDKILSQNYYRQFIQIKENILKKSSKYTVLMVTTTIILIVTAIHLWERIQIILFDIDMFPVENTNIDLIAHVIFQFVFATLSALYILFTIYRHARNIEEIERSRVLVQLEQEKERAREMEKSSMEDPLTGILNRKGLHKIIQDEQLDKKHVEIMLIDIDYFKSINDTYGHSVGDIILTEVAKCLVKTFGEKSVFRIGGDEFAVIFEKNIVNNSQNEIVKEQLEQIYSYISNIKINDIKITLSIGVCFSKKGYTEKWYTIVDGALYETKNNGRSGCTLVNEEGQVIDRWKAGQQRH